METTGFCECFAGNAFSRDTCETFCFARFSFLIHIICTHTIYTPITHKCWGVLLSENPSHKHWELEIVIPTILYTITCGFSSTPTSPFPYHWEVDSPNSYHTLSECQVRFWCCWEALEEVRLWWMQSGVLRDPESYTRHDFKKPCWSRSLEGLSALGRLGLEGLLLFVYPNWLFSGSITAWKAAERFYAEYFGFLFDNTSVCYLVFAFFFPTLLPFIFFAVL